MIASGWLLRSYVGLFFAFLYAPILVLFILSFNDSEVMGFPFRGFTLRWYGEVFEGGGLVKALVNSFAVGLASATIATALALMAALGLRYQFPGRGWVIPAFLLPIITPGIVSGVMLLVFLGLTGVPYGLWTGSLIAHVTWVLPFAFLTLYPRLHKFDRSIEEAAMDLGATPWVVFLRIVLPLIQPALIATLLFAFTLSFDEFIRTLFVAGSDRTTPVHLWLLIVEQVAPELPAVGVVIMSISALIAALGFWLSGRASRLAAAVERR
ncbi:MAG: ABC transporter permease [Betaproteobacteria bacterium]|nr:ABC transporter permease [Betaproteobacteria bacterium]